MTDIAKGKNSMEKWEAVAKRFIEQCDFINDIEAVFLTGSYAAGNSDMHSDIDLYIVLNENVNWRVRGNKWFDGFRIEYFANPVKQIKAYIDSSYTDVSIQEINMILNGIIIYNKNSTAESLIEYCDQKSKENFPALGDYNVKMGLYQIWDNFDELTRAYENKTADFSMQYYMFIKNAFEFYSRYICSPVPNYHHLYKWLTCLTYQTRYKLPQYNDANFLDLISKSFTIIDSNNMFIQAKEIKDYIFERINGFDIDNFILKGPCGS